MRHLGEMVVEEPVSGSLVILRTSIGAKWRVYVWLELLGIICTRQHG